VWHGVILGALMGGGMLLQTAGLGLTSVAVSSFLTSLTVLFVPLIGILIHLKLPSPILTTGVLLATAGIWLLTGATSTGFGIGEVLGLSCAIVFSFQIMAINAFTTPANTHRITTTMLLTSGVIGLVATPVFSPRLDIGFVLDQTAWPRMLLLIFVCTIGAFGLQMTFQPRVNPTRAALLYLFEPIFAAGWAYLEMREKLSWTQFSGAALIIVANALVELLSAWGKKEETQKVALP
jgi:drug/metabolite transporter (DMT)-like permease